jgi:hypothetical protein
VITTVAEAVARLEAAGAMTLVPAVATVPSLIAAIVGGPVRGSWWSHPLGRQIFTIATGLEESGLALTAKLVAGKVTFVHRRLWPALVRVVTDPAWRAARIAGLPPPAQQLLALVEHAGEVDAAAAAAAVGGAAIARTARGRLEALALVHSASQHTERGHHASVLHAWSRWAPAEVATAARSLEVDAARAALAAAGIEL